MDTKNVIEFYDGFVAKQSGSGINDRIYLLYKRLLHLGLRPDSNILELGSGIGSLTFLLSRYINKGQIEAVDISPESIGFSKQRIKTFNTHFFAADIVSHVPSIQNIDFITLFDVIEHVPIERHCELFRNIASFCKEDTKILINIPNPAYLEYDIKNNPGTLQIIDQPLPLKLILENFENNGLSLAFFENYSIWVENDYQFFVVKKRNNFKEILLNDKRTFLQKVARKLQRTYIKMKYRYHDR